MYLSYNKLNETLPSFLFTLPLLENLYLDGNMFSGGLPSELFNCHSLKRLSLRSNQLDDEISGGSTQPLFIQLANLTFLDISSNKFTGLWDSDTFLSSLPNLQGLDLSNNGLAVITNKSSSIYVNPNFHILRLASCKLALFPESIRAMKKLTSLDLSKNDIHGRIPDWAGQGR
ncbi:hypothetical protein L2E82_32068 [Cichorium intybus]|uniref:Uncharacterized protein n=1 Tax=Cichorium intybus TaxID=13427 RepID=A0ACB9BGH5_CICIN|nr:hypothetical protein L2E82_32068 [Cichorium intybus]